MSRLLGKLKLIISVLRLRRVKQLFISFLNTNRRIMLALEHGLAYQRRQSLVLLIYCLVNSFAEAHAPVYLAQ
jgi:hypothetical protein